MSTRTRVIAIAAAVAMLGAAFVVRLTQPSDEQQLAPFVLTMAPGQRAEGRDLTLEVTEVYLADRVTSPDWTGETDGVWLIVDATVGAKLGVTSPYATLTAGGVEWDASDRPDRAALGASLAAGLPQRGSFVFELPESLIDSDAGRSAVIRFATAFAVRLDSAIDLPLDLSALERRASATLQEPGVVAP
jgi:hypothetical protein